MTTASQNPETPRPAEPLVRTAAGVIAAAIEHGASTPAEIAQAEADAGIIYDPQRVEEIASAAAEQAHAEDQAEIAERGRQLASMAGAARQRDAVLRLLEGRPGTDLLTVAEIAAAAEYGTTALDGYPMTLTWSHSVRMRNGQVIVHCTSSYGGRADLVVEGDARTTLASLLQAAADPDQQTPEYLDTADYLDARYGPGASDEYAMQVAEAHEEAVQDEHGEDW
ncbi:hypothetical protein [Streptomyces antibioticus]|uniref:hypothetical protein n=1 Tax=Streptomyces antibioticus TaxID=1890 RepID=UPI0036B60856